MSKILFTFGPWSMFFTQELMNFCTGLLEDRMHIPSPHQLIKRQNSYWSLAWLETDRRKYFWNKLVIQSYVYWCRVGSTCQLIFKSSQNINLFTIGMLLSKNVITPGKYKTFTKTFRLEKKLSSVVKVPFTSNKQFVIHGKPMSFAAVWNACVSR